MSYCCFPKSLIQTTMTVFGFIFASIVVANAQTCLKSGTEADINRALQGSNAAAVLCPGAVFALNNPVVFTAANQRLSRRGFLQTELELSSASTNSGITNAINGNNQTGIVIQNIQVDGNRSAFGHLTGPALIEIGGGGLRPTVFHIVAFGTRSWSTIHIFEGKGCKRRYTSVPNREHQ